MKSLIKFRILTLVISILLFFLSTVFLPRILNMETQYANFVNSLKIFTFIFNILLFLVNLQINKFKFFIVATILIVSFFVLDPTLMNFIGIVLYVSTFRDKKIVIKAYFFIKLLLFITVIYLGFFGLNSENIIYSIERGIRYSLGFTNPNTASMILFDIVITSSILFHKKNFLLSSSISVFLLFIYTNTRTLLLGYLIFLIIYLIPENRIKLLKPILVPLFALGSLFSYGLILFSNTSLDFFLNGRLTIMKNFITNNNITFFGLDRSELIATSDNTYLRILFEFGLIFFLIYLVIHFILMSKLFRNHNYAIIRVVFAVGVYDLFEQFSIAHGSVLLIFLSFLIYKKNINRRIIYENSYNGANSY